MKIFIIEDEPAIREELVQLLQKYGYQCDSSDDFLHIVQAALSSGANLILLDTNLPYQDGFQVCREIRQKSNLPIIVLTSRNSDFDELMSLNIGADDYIAKPYNAQILLARISDNGIGISAADLPRVFDKGFTGENGRRYSKSTGIGLYLSQRLCRKMNISLSISSVPGQGTTVTMVFPTESYLQAAGL